MKVFTKSKRNNQTVYSSHEGMSEQKVKELMKEIGHTNIDVIEEGTYLTAVEKIQSDLRIAQ